MKPGKFLIFIFVVFSLVLSACNSRSTETPANPEQTQLPVATQIPSPTVTSLPLALTVNGEGVLLSDYDAEIGRLQSALTELGQEMTPEQQKERVIGNFTDELLLSQAAAAAGYVVTDADVQVRIDKMVTDLGSAEKLTAWQAANNYTDESFRAALKREMAVAWQRDQIANAVPLGADQVHARQLLYQNQANAQEALYQLGNGVDFDTLAYEQDPVLGGDLGWFPRGTLTQPAVEEAVFALQPGEMTGIIASDLGFHIVKLIEREEGHPLSIEARLMLQKAAIADWLTAARATAVLEVLVP